MQKTEILNIFIPSKGFKNLHLSLQAQIVTFKPSDIPLGILINVRFTINHQMGIHRSAETLLVGLEFFCLMTSHHISHNI